MDGGTSANAEFESRVEGVVAAWAAGLWAAGLGAAGGEKWCGRA
jgi:hypothetical protein